MLDSMTQNKNLNGELNQAQFQISKVLEYDTAQDETLASLFTKNQDEQAFNEIVRRYGDKIFRLALRITRDEESAEEILQNDFIKLVKKLDTFREESKLSKNRLKIPHQIMTVKNFRNVWLNWLAA